jgi:WD40 repeat protein
MKAIAFFMLSMISMAGLSQDLLKLSIREKGVSAVKHSPDNLYFVLANGNEAELYNAGNDTKIKDFTGAYKSFKNGHTGDILDFAFNNLSSLMASASADKTIKLWKLPSGELSATLEGHNDDVTELCFADNDQYLISVSDDMSVIVWDTKTQKNLFQKKEHTKAIRTLDVSPDGKQFATGGGDKTVIVWETSTGNVVKKLNGHENWVRSLAFSPAKPWQAVETTKILSSGTSPPVIRSRSFLKKVGSTILSFREMENFWLRHWRRVR